MRRPSDRQAGGARKALPVERGRLAAVVNHGDDVRGEHRQAEHQSEVLMRVAMAPGNLVERPIVGRRIDRFESSKCPGQQLDQRRVWASLQGTVGSGDDKADLLAAPQPDNRTRQQRY